jgi:hypothetical protein
MVIGEDYDHQNNCFFYVKRFNMIRGLRLGVFFTLKTPKKIIELSLGRIFVSGGFRVLRWFFGFLMAIDWFNKVSMVFSRCFGSK